MTVAFCGSNVPSTTVPSDVNILHLVLPTLPLGVSYGTEIIHRLHWTRYSTDVPDTWHPIFPPVEGSAKYPGASHLKFQFGML